MKLHLSLLLAACFLLSSCEEKVAAGDKLTPDERDYLRGLATAKCNEESAADFDDFKALSNDKIEDFTRDMSWKYELKKNGSADATETNSISVWKVVPPNIYFRINIMEGTTRYNKFLKLSTTTNSEMIAALLSKKCAKALTMTHSSSSATATIIDKRITAEEANTFYDITTAYRFNYNFPAYFGVLDNTKTQKTVNAKDVVTKTDTFVYSITAVASPAVQNNLYVYYSNRKYCVVKFTAGSPNIYAYPYLLDCTEVDATTGPTGFALTELAI
jgi:hypothetical protein